MKKLWILAVAIGLASATAQAQVVQPMYVRPSKGAAIKPFGTSGDPTITLAAANGQSVTFVSAVYDMTAFSAGQVSLTVLEGNVTTNYNYEVGNLSSYIRVRVTNSGVLAVPSTKQVWNVQVQGSPSVSGPYTTLTAQFSEYGGINDTGTKLTIQFTPVPFSSNVVTSGPLVDRNYSFLYPSLGGGISYYTDVFSGKTKAVAASINPTTTAFYTDRGSRALLAAPPAVGIDQASISGVFTLAPSSTLVADPDCGSNCFGSYNLRLQNVGTTTVYCKAYSVPTDTDFDVVLSPATSLDAGDGGSFFIENMTSTQAWGCRVKAGTGKVTSLLLRQTGF